MIWEDVPEISCPLGCVTGEMEAAGEVFDTMLGSCEEIGLLEATGLVKLIEGKGEATAEGEPELGSPVFIELLAETVTL